MTAPTQAQIKAAAEVIEFMFGQHLREIETDVTRGMTEQTIKETAKAALTAAAQVGPSQEEMRYLRSILFHLREFQDIARRMTSLNLGTEVLDDNVGWLDCFIEKHQQTAAAQVGGPDQKALARYIQTIGRSIEDRTIERCAQVADNFIDPRDAFANLPGKIAAAIRKLKDERENDS